MIPLSHAHYHMGAREKEKITMHFCPLNSSIRLQSSSRHLVSEPDKSDCSTAFQRGFRIKSSDYNLLREFEVLAAHENDDKFGSTLTFSQMVVLFGLLQVF